MTNQRVVELLRQIGWNVETAHEAGLSGKVEDVDLAIYARNNKRIYITFDELRAEQGEKVSRELRKNGGHVIRIQGGADQDKFRIVGKILFHYPEWYPFLSANSGISLISDIRKQSCVNWPPKEYHHRYHRLDAEQFTEYLEKRKSRPYRPRPRKPKPPPDQQILLT